MRGLLAASLGVIGCAEPERRTAPETTPPTDAPVLSHVPPAGALLGGDRVVLELEALDPDGIREAALYQRTVGGTVFVKEPLVDQGDGTWSASVPVRAPGLEYWFRAVDASDFVVAADLPADGEAAPFLLAVGEAALPVPWEESFDTATGPRTLHLLGWAEHARATGGFEWRLSELRSRSAPWAAQHRPGDVPIDDWLVAPTLDLSTLADAQVTWWEHGDNAAGADHSLWVSTGSADPADGDFTLAATLDPPAEDAWTRAPLVDLSAWAGEAEVTLAWRTRGAGADLWTLDDVRVDPLGPDLVLRALRAGPLGPGESGTLTVELEARGAPLPADLVLTGASEPQDPLFTDVVPRDTAVGRFARDIALALDPGVPDDSLLEVMLTATSGPHSWSWTESLLVGDPSLATVGIELDAPGFVAVTVGAGDPAEPSVELDALGGVLAAAAHTAVVDLTEQAELLPPAPGPGRWWVRVDSEIAGWLTDFRIATGLELLVADDLGAFGPGESLFYLPGRPEPVVEHSRTNPDLTPGGSATWELAVANLGGPTVGRTTLTLSSPDGAGLARPGPHLLADEGWPTGGSFALESEVSAPADHRDSSPLEVWLTVTDELESQLVRAWVAVPWPVLDVSRVTIDDGSGNGDGLLDPGERVELGLTLTNRGDLRTSALSCALTWLSGEAHGTAGGTAEIGVLDPAGIAVIGPFTVEVEDGRRGDRIDLGLACEDPLGSWLIPITLHLSEPPWQWFTERADARGDNLDAYPFDFVSGRWRVVGDILHVELRSAVPFDPATLFVEAWMESPDAPWSLYQVVAQSGLGTLRAYEGFGWWSLAEPVIRTVDPQTVGIDIPISALELARPTLRLGWAAGWCGGRTYFCDHYPEGWGDPYENGLEPSRWVDITW